MIDRVHQLKVDTEQPLIATKFKFEWRIDGGEIGGEEYEEIVIDMNKIMKIEEQLEIALLEMDADNSTYEQENENTQEDTAVIHNKI